MRPKPSIERTSTGRSAQTLWRKVPAGGQGIQTPFFSPMPAAARYLTPLDADFGVGCGVLSVDGAAEMRRSLGLSTGEP
jgi:hypothetical protein